MTRAVAVTTIALLAGLMLAARVRLSAGPLHADVSAWAVIGHEMTVGGRPLYADLWERKPPLLYLTFAAAEQGVGYGPREVLLVNVVAAWAVLAGVYVAAAAHGGRSAGLVAAGLWAATSTDLNLYGDLPNPELMINAAMAGAIAVLLVRPRWWQGVAAGVLLAAATFYKHNAAAAVAAVLVGYGWTTRRAALHRSEPSGSAAGSGPGEQSQSEEPAAEPLGSVHVEGDRPATTRRWRPAVVAGAFVVVAWAAFLGRAYAVGRGPATVDVLFRQNVAYAGGGVVANLLGGLAPSRLFAPFLGALIGPALLVVLFAIVPRTGRRLGPAWGLLLAWAIGTWATVSVTGLLYPHYWQLWLPVAAVGGGWAAAGLWPRRGGRAVVLVVLTVVVVRQGSQFLKPPAQWAHDQYDYSVAHQNEFAAWVGSTLGPDERVWELGNDNNLYFLSGHSPPSGLLYLDPLLYGSDPAANWRRLLADLDRRPPDLVVFSSDWQMFYPAPLPIGPWLRDRYDFWRTVTYDRGPDRPTTYTLFVRRGGRLDRDRVALPVPRQGA